MKRYPLILTAAAVIALAATSCKPTEAGYKAAYEAAQAQKAAEQNDAALYGLIMESGASWHHVGSDSVLYKRDILAPLEGDTFPRHDFNVAVAAYKMNTNAISHAARLSENGYKARVLKNPAGMFLVIAAEFDSIAPTAPFIKEYRRSHPSDMYSGLPGMPVVQVLRGAKL